MKRDAASIALGGVCGKNSLLGGMSRGANSVAALTDLKKSRNSVLT